jgi:hypothetical protein
MGLISFVKNIYYNNKLNNAIKQSIVRDYSQAEAGFTELISKHPEAVTELAKLYIKQAHEQSDFLNYCQKALSCESKLVKGISNKTSYQAIKEEILKLNYNQFKRFYSEGNYKRALDFSNLLFNYRNDESFIKEHYKCLFDYAISIASSEGEKTNSLLKQTYNDCKNKSFLSEIFKETISKIFERAKEYSSIKEIEYSNNLCAVIKDDIFEAKHLLINNYIENIELYKTNDSEIQKLVKVVCSLPDKNISLKYLEKLVFLSNEAKILYIKYVVELSNELIKSKNYKGSIDLLEYGISLFYESVFTDQLIIISCKYIEEAEYNLSITLLNKLVSKHPDAEPLLAKCFLNLSLQEKSNDYRKVLLLKAFEFKNNQNKLFNDKLYESIFREVVSNIIEVAYKYGEFTYYSDSYALLDLVLLYEPASLNAFIKVKLLEINSLTSIDKQIELYKETIEVAKQKMSGLINLKDLQLDILYIELINATLKKFSKSDDDTTIQGLAALKKEIQTQNYQTDNINLSISKLDAAIAERYLKKGLANEIQNQFDEAIACYNILYKDFKNVSEIIELILLRIQIVFLKNTLKFKKSINNKTINELLRNSKRNNVVVDLAYRYVIHLIKNAEISNAINVIENYLPSKSKEVILLKDICKNAEIKMAKDFLVNLNLKIAKISAEELSVDEAMQIISEIEVIETNCAILNDIEGRILELKDNLIDYVIFKSFKAENYHESLHYIKKYKNNYITDDILFRNAAIASIGIIAMGRMNEGNFKELISFWVTAIFNVKLFIDSLSYTSWDDKFMFSIQTSLGSLIDDDKENIPVNVNYDDVDDTNISIGEVQKYLLDKIENYISKDCYNDNIKIVCLDFLHAEINAITSLYSLELEYQIFGCTPYFAKQNNYLLEQISESLTNELQYSGINSEDVLKVGILYNMRENQFKFYSDAIILKNKSIEVIKSKSESQIKLIFTKQNISKIKNYDELYLKLCNDLREEFKNQIKDERYFEKTITYFLVVCQAISDENLDYLVSNSTNRICVSKLNEETISKSNGLKILADVYKVIKNNDKLNENIQAIINAAVIDVILEDDRTLKSIVFKTIENSHGVFDRGIIDTLNQAVEIIIISGKIEELKRFVADFNTKTTCNGILNNVVTKAKDIQVSFELSNIIDQLNSGSITEIVGLERTFELYKTNKSHSRVCENLVVICGNLIHSHVIQRTSSSSRVTRILDELIKNRSAVFIRSAVQLSNQREEILNSLPFEARGLMTGLSLYGQSLTPEGEVLKKGLNYLKQLSN